MKTKVKKLFIPYLSLVLILSNFSFATTLVFCDMDGGNDHCSCANTNDIGKYGPAIRSVTESCCETKIVELSNSNILEVLFSNTVSPLTHVNLINSVDITSFSVSAQVVKTYNELAHHPPNSEIPIINSSLLI
jgi:hypothetical protein